MKQIIVVDDYPEVPAEWRRALRTKWADKAPEVIDINRPEDVLTTLRAHPDAGLIVIDLDFGRASQSTGLLALQQLEDFLRERPDHPVRAAIMTADEQDNRLLLLLAAFQLFDPPPIDLVRKSADHRETAIVELVDTLRRGNLPRDERIREYKRRPGTPQQASMMYRLVCERYGRNGRTALDVWRGLLTAHSTADLKAMVGLGNQLYQYLPKAASAAAEVAAKMQRAPEALKDVDRLLGREHDQRTANKVFTPLSQFAQRNALFFEARELDTVVGKFAPDA